MRFGREFFRRVRKGGSVDKISHFLQRAKELAAYLRLEQSLANQIIESKFKRKGLFLCRRRCCVTTVGARPSPRTDLAWSAAADPASPPLTCPAWRKWTAEAEASCRPRAGRCSASPTMTLVRTFMWLVRGRLVLDCSCVSILRNTRDPSGPPRRPGTH